MSQLMSNKLTSDVYLKRGQMTQISQNLSFSQISKHKKINQSLKIWLPG